jgi:vancomycin permeability regulator SanA
VTPGRATREAHRNDVRLPRKETLADALRFVGFAVGVFVATNLAGEAIRGPFDTVPQWITIPGPRWFCLLIEACAAAALIVGPFARRIPARIRAAAAILLAGLAALSIIDAARFYAALERGSIATPVIVPASIPVALVLGALAALLFFERSPAPLSGRRRLVVAASAVVATVLALPLLRMAMFGPTRYVRDADCAIVLGARVWNDGTPSHALADRVDEAIRLYQDGHVRRLLMSGAIDDGNGFSEPAVMKARAVAAGVPSDAILLDEAGVDTASTVQNSARLARAHAIGSALVVSHYYHEPRLKMLFDRTGMRAYTVPARMKHRLAKEPYFVAREIAAYYHSFLLE